MQFENTISYSLGSLDKPLCLSDDHFFFTISLTFLCTLIPQHYYQLNFLSTWATNKELVIHAHDLSDMRKRQAWDYHFWWCLKIMRRCRTICIRLGISRFIHQRNTTPWFIRQLSSVFSVLELSSLPWCIPYNRTAFQVHYHTSIVQNNGSMSICETLSHKLEKQGKTYEYKQD